MREMVAIIIMMFGMAACVFLVVFGAVEGKPELITTGMTVLGGATGSVLTYLYGAKNIDQKVARAIGWLKNKARR